MVHVAPRFGDILEVRAKPSDLVGSLRERIAKHCHIPVPVQSLVMKGGQISDASTLCSLHIVDGATISVSWVTDVLTDLLKVPNSDALCLDILERCPYLASEMGHGGVWPLHMALNQCRPEALVLKLAESSSKGVRARMQAEQIFLGAPLNFAVLKGYSPTLVQAMLDAKAGFKHERNRFRLSLHLALERGKLDIVKVFLKQGFPVDACDVSTHKNALECAVCSKHAEQVFGLVLVECFRSYPTLLWQRNPSGHTLLHIAPMDASPETLADLCDLIPGACAVPDMSGNLPIHCAMLRKTSIENVRRLIQTRPESLHAQGSQGRTPLQIAVTCGASRGVTAEILSADPSTAGVLCPRGNTVLELAVAADASSYIIKELLEGHPWDVDFDSPSWRRTRAWEEAVRLSSEMKGWTGWLPSSIRAVMVRVVH